MAILPLFPLGLVVFPKEKLNLHIFEPRYKQLIIECYKEEKTFGIPPVKDGKRYELGTEVQLLEISKTYPDGKMDIKTKGLRVFKILDFYSQVKGKFYPGGEVEYIEETPSTVNILEYQEVKGLVQELYHLMNLSQQLPEWDDTFSLNEIAHKLGLNFDQEIEFLKIRTEADRVEYIKVHLEKLIPVITQLEEMKKKVKMNGHFKNVIPPNLDA